MRHIFQFWPVAVNYLIDLMPPRIPVIQKLIPTITPEEPFEDPPWINELRDQQKNLLFFYGDPTPHCVSPAYTLERQSLWHFKENNAPIAIRKTVDLQIPREKIKGQLLVLKDKAIEDLDFEWGKGVNFDRRQVSVFVPLLDCEGSPYKLMAWEYTGTDRLKEKIEWDNSFYRGKGRYSLANIAEDLKRRWIGKHYTNGELIAKAAA